MTLVSRSIPGLFGGVSQKIPALRNPTQGSAQDNGISTVVDGLFKRPGTRHVATLPVTGPGGLSVANSAGRATGHFVDRSSRGRHVLVLTNGGLMLYDLNTGQPQEVLAPQGFSYLQSAAPEKAFRCLTVADTTFIVNTEVIPRLTADTTPTNPVNEVYVNVRQVASKNTYSLTVDGQVVTFTTGDNPKNSDVANSLAGQMATRPGYTASRLPDTNCIRVVKTNGSPITMVRVYDTFNNAGLQILSNGVERYSELPQRFEGNFVITIKGTEGASSDYFVKWNGGGYEECAAPGVKFRLDPATMPHQLKPNPDGTWTFSRIDEWAERQVGDDDTNPPPSFVDVGINSVFFHRNRLGFLGGDSAVLSRAGDFFNFWSSSAQQVLDTDPIDLAAGADSVSSLEWATGFNQTLLVWSNTNQQFVLTAGDIMSPKTARLVPTTAFPFKPAVRPVSVGNKAIFTAPLGEHTQVHLYKVSADRATNTADDLTEDCPRYLPSSVTHLSVGDTPRALVATSHDWTNEVFVWKWEEDADQRLTQRAWQRFTLDRSEPVRVLGTYWVERTLYFLLATRATSEVDVHFSIERMEFGKPKDDFAANVPLLLDRAVLRSPSGSVGGNTTFDLPYPLVGEVVALKPRAGLEPEELSVLAISKLGPTATRVTVSGSHAQPCVLGQPFDFRYEFTEPFMQDREGVPWMASHLKHVRTLLRYEDTGGFLVEVAIPLRQTYVYPFNGRIAGQPNQAASQVALSSGEFSIPVQAKAQGVRMSIKSASYLPCCFPFAEWVGQLTVKARR
ncbi:MAG: hypothetical protein ACK4K3_07440 [Aquabacterium sp.]